MQKYKLESNSQPYFGIDFISDGWELYAKIQIRKQFTTHLFSALNLSELGIICKNTN